MCKRIFLSFLAIVCFITVKAQINYVLNPGFETHTGCPDYFNEIKLATYWEPIDTVDFQPLCSPEYRHVCAINPVEGVPGGYIPHYCRTGSGMAQVLTFYDNTSASQQYHRDYLQGHLYHPLITGQSYCVTFYVYIAGVYGINHIGAYFDNGSIDTATNPYCAHEQTEYTPQVVELNIIKDTVTDSFSWHKIEGSFIATGNERFITIGNFVDKASTQYILLVPPQDTVGLAANGGGFSWILVDDVSVIATNALPHAGHDTTIYAGDSVFIGPHEISLPYWWYKLGSESPIDSGGGIWVRPDTTTTYILQQTLCGLNTYDTVTITVVPDTTNVVGSIVYNNNALVYPNPANNLINITHLQPGTEITIVNLLGQSVLPQQQTTSTKKEIDIHMLPTGTYYIQLTYAGQRVVRKLTITR
jgi:hypothetical protein